MKKVLTFIFTTVLVCSMGMFNSTNAKTLKNDINKKSDKIYEKHYIVDLKDLNIKMENENVIITQKNTIKSLLNIEDENLNNINKMIQNKNFEKDLKKMINEGHTPLAIGVAEAEFEVTKDLNGYENLRPLTENEVKNSIPTGTRSIQGQTQYRDKLSLYTTVSGSSPSYWVQSNAYWKSGILTGRRDAIGLTWESSFGINNNSKCSVVTDNLGNLNGSLEQISAHRGAAWSFPCGMYHGGDEYTSLKGVYAGASITRSGSKQKHFFSSEYIHTSQKLNWSAELAYDSNKLTKATLKLNPSPSSWKLVSYVSGTF